MDRRKNRTEGEEKRVDAKEIVNVSFQRLTPHELREVKENLLNIVAAALIQQPRMSLSDPTMQRITLLAKKVAFYDPEFILKLAMYVRLDLNIRSTANYLLALACNINECQPYVKKYFVPTIRLPSDWLDVAATYQLLPDKQLKNKALPTCLRRAMVEKFPDFDAYQLGKYNKERSIKRKIKKQNEKGNKKGGNKGPKGGGDQKPMLTIKQMIRQLHISTPNYNIMCLLGKKYPTTEREFQECNLPGKFDPEKSGKRMKLPVPETWETLLSEKGNKASTWEELIEHKKLPFMAMLRNLRNMINAGIHPRYHRWVQNKLSDAKTVANSKQFPFQFFSAYEVIPRDLEHFKQLIKGEPEKEEKGDAKKGDVKKGDAKKGEEQKRRKKKKLIVPAHMPTDKTFEDYRKAIDNAVKLATIHNVAPIRGSTVVFCNVSKETQQAAPGAKGMGSSVKKISEVGYLLGLMCKYVCEDCDFRIYSSSSAQHPNTTHLPVELIEGTILDNMKVVAKKATELGDQEAKFPFDYLEEMIRDKRRVDNFLVLSHKTISPESSGESQLSNLLKKYRSEVNPDMLFVSVDLSGSGKSAIGNDEKHPNDITITGFSDQILRFIAERGDQNQLQYVEHIDEAKDVDNKKKEQAAAAAAAVDVSPWWRWLDMMTVEQQNVFPKIVMGPKWRSARVFLSSTFLDMNGERDVLTRIVFPQIKERAKKRKLELFEVDLRWGVTEEEAKEGKSIQLCLDEVERCRPFFLGILGDRYGWAPPDWNDLPAHERFNWVRAYPKGRSITELEMQLAALNNPHGDLDGTFFYFRNSGFKNQVPEKYSRMFIGTPEETAKLAALKQRVRDAGLPLFEDYPANFFEDSEAKPVASDLTAFADRVFNDLWGAIDRRFPPEKPSSDPLELERSYHQSFAYALSQNFIGRNDVMTQMKRFVASSCGTILVVTAKPGEGKSSLLANFAKQLAEKDEKTFVLPHFVGASPGSTDIRSTLHRLCCELKKVFGMTDIEIPEEYKDLEIIFPKILEEASFRGKLVILIDAINQLDNRIHRAHTLDWLPAKIPCKIIVSTISGDACHISLKHKFSFGHNFATDTAQEIQLLPLSAPERTELIRQLLWKYHKKLDERPMNNQMRSLLRKTDSGSPLYLTVACEELRLFAHFEEITNFIKNMGPTIGRLFDEVLTRLEKDHGKFVVQDMCALIGVSRSGMLEEEIRSILGISDRDFQALLRSLSAFLKPTGDNGELQFFHQQFEKAVEKKYLPNARTIAKYHAKLATHFYERIDPEKNGSWTTANDPRAVKELPHHLVKSENWTDVVRVLCDLSFVELKVSLGQTYDLISDYNEATSEQTEGSSPANYDGKSTVREYKHFVKSNAYVLQRNPLLTFQQAANQPAHTAPAKQAAERWKSGGHQHPWIQWINKPRDADYCKMTFSGFPDGMTAGDFSDDGKLVACASRDCIVRIYSAETGTEIAALSGHSNLIASVKFSPEGGRLSTASWDGSVKVWDTRTGGLIATLADHDRRVNCITYSKDGQYIASASWDCTVKIWNGKEFDSQNAPRPVKTIYVGDRPVNSCAFSPDDKEILAGTWDGKIAKFEIETGKVTLAFSEIGGHTKSVQSVAYAPSGKHAVSGSLDKRLVLWDAHAGKSIATLSKHGKEITSVAYSTDGNHVVAASADATTKVWGSNLGRERRSIKLENGYLNCVEFHPKNPGRVVAGSSECTVVVWDIAEGKEILTTSGYQHTRPVIAVGYNPEGTLIASASEDSVLAIWNAETGEIVSTIKGHNGPISNIAWSPIAGDSRIATSSDDFTVKIWDAQKGTELLTLKGHSSVVRDVVFDPKGKLIATASRDNSLRIWDSRNGNMLGEPLYGHKDWLNCLDFSPSGSRIVTGSWDFTLCIWNVRTSKPSEPIRGHNSAIAICKFTPDSNKVISASFDGTIKIWDAETGSEITTLGGHTARVNGLSVSKDGKYVVSVSDDQTIKVWDPFSATEVGTLIGHAGPVRSSAFSPTNKHVITASDDKTIKLWDLGLGEKKEDEGFFSSFSFSSATTSAPEKKAEISGNLQGHSGWINDVKISPQGDTLISVSDDASFSQWDARTLERSRVLRTDNDRAFKACDLDVNGTLALTATDDGIVTLWDMRAKKKISDVAKHVGPATSCVFSKADSNVIVSCGWDKKVLVSDSRKRGNSKELLSHDDWILSAEISSDGQYIASCGWDKSICLWNASGSLRTRLTDGHTNTITCVGFSPDNRYLASASYDGTVKLWNCSSTIPKLDKLLVGHNAHVNKVAFTTKSDNTLLSAGSDHVVRIWDMTRGELKNEFVCQGPATAVHATRTSKDLLLAFGDSIGNVYLGKYISE